MTWVRLDDGFAGHPKIEEVGPLAAWLFVAGLCHCATYLTDGFIAESKANRLITEGKPRVHIDRLVRVGLWDKVDGGYRVHDYLHYQPSREKVQADRDAAAERQRKSREKREAESHRQSQRDIDARHGVTDGVSHTTPTRPDPTRSLSLVPSVDFSHQPYGDVGRDSRVVEAIELLSAADANRPNVNDPASFLDKCRQNRWRLDRKRLDMLAEEHPHATAQMLADMVPTERELDAM